MIEVKHQDPILRTFILFTQTADAVLKYADAYLFRKAGLSVIKLVVMQILVVNGGTMEPSKIAEWTTRERHNITTLVERMQRDRLVKAERSERDRRFKNITITDKGRKLLKKATPVARKIVNQVMSSLNEEDVVLLEKSLAVLRQNAGYGLEQIARRSKNKPD